MNAWRLGEACRHAAEASAGDYIDRGLALLKMLEARGYGVFRFVKDARPTPQADGEGEFLANWRKVAFELGDGHDVVANRNTLCQFFYIIDRLTGSKAPAEVTCTCPSGDGSLRWPCPKHPPSGDANVDAVCSLLYARSRKGVKEYGVNTERPDFGRDDWLRELQTELLDGAVYVQAALAALRPTSTTRAGEG